MDGLDEVPTELLRRKVQNQVKKVSEEYSKGNRFVLTCRTQIMGVIPSGFTSVEVADFSPEQIKQFIHNWFLVNGKSEDEAYKRWETIQLTTSSQPDLEELTKTPVLLSLICLVLQDQGEIPTNRAWLYSKGIKLLLGRWNDEKEIENWKFGTEAYRQLSIKDKEELLIEIAAQKFENPRNFVLFEQDDLAKQITQKLQLPSVQEGIAVLKSIEAQHGLLIERADELWSFSHLTFQEYFTVQWLTQLPPQQLTEKIADQQWQKVVEQLVKSQQPADRLLRLVKHAIDQSVTQESVIQAFLNWLIKKTGSLQTNYKSAAIRAFYYSLTCIFTLDLTRTFDLILDLARVLDNDIEYDIDLALDRSRDRAHSFALDLALARALTIALDRDLTRTRARNLALNLTQDRACTRARPLARDRDLACALARDRDLACDLALALDLALGLASKCTIPV